MSYYDQLCNRMKGCLRTNNSTFKDEIKSLKDFCDSIYELINQYRVFILCDGATERELLAYDSLYSNLEYLCIAVYLSERGQFAQARALFRNVYETLVVIKYISISNNDSFVERYKNDNDIRLRQDIYRNVTMTPNDKRILEQFYRDLCLFSHFSFYSNALIENMEQRKKEVAVNFEISRILLCLTYHVINSYCYISKYKAKIDRLIITRNNEASVAERRKKCRDTNKKIKKELNDRGRKIVYIFSKKWQVNHIS